MAFFTGVLNTLLVVCSLFLICLILIQRGKGGGLAGAFGGVGGSSAFGTKAGDVFTRVTIGVAVVWIVLSMLLVVLNNRQRPSAFQAGTITSSPNEVTPSGAGKAKAVPPGVPPPPIAPKGDAGLPSAIEDEPTPPAAPAKTEPAKTP